MTADQLTRAQLRIAEEALRQITGEWVPSKRRMMQIADEALDEIGKLGAQVPAEVSEP